MSNIILNRPPAAPSDIVSTGSTRPEWRSSDEVADSAFQVDGDRSDNFNYAVFRASYSNRDNDTASLLMSKLQPRKPSEEEWAAAGMAWPVTAARSTVILAPGVPDEYEDPRRLVQRYEQERLPQYKELFTAATWSFPDANTLHESFDMLQAFATRQISRERRLSSLLVQHVPAQAGSARPMHVHLLILPRVHTPLGFAEYVPALMRDIGHDVLFEEWQAWK